MKQLFIPEIGTEFILAKDWKFDLYAESRNKNLLKYFGAYIAPYQSTAIFEKDLPNFKLVYDYNFPSNEEDYYTTNIFGDKKFLNNKYYEARSQYLDNNPVNIEYNKQIQIWHENVKRVNNHKSISIVLKKGTLLKIDRIYIRKGVSDYSSISFFAEINKKRIRFWAKLDDCNKIIFK